MPILLDARQGGEFIGNGNASVGTTEVTLRAANELRTSIIVHNAGPGTLYLGTDGVTTGNTTPILDGGSLALDRSAAAKINAICSSTCDVRFFEERLS